MQKKEKLEIYGIFEDGELKIYNQELIALWASHLESGQEIQIRFTPTKSIRTLKQNALLWTLYTRVGDYIGEHKEDIHTYFKSKFLPPKIVEVNFEQVYECGSTAVLSTKEMSEYIFKINQWAIEKLEMDLLSFDEKQFLKE
jgi:hypothetical protein